MGCHWSFVLLILILLILALFIAYFTGKRGRGSFCRNNNQCKEDLICNNNICVFNPDFNNTTFPGEVCYAEWECPTNYYCSGTGQCLRGEAADIDQPCEDDQDCGLGALCSCAKTCNFGDPNYLTDESPAYYTIFFGGREYYLNGTIKNGDKEGLVTFSTKQEPINLYQYDAGTKLLFNYGFPREQCPSLPGIVNPEPFLTIGTDGQIRNSFTEPEGNIVFYLRPFSDTELILLPPDVQNLPNVYCLQDQYANTIRLLGNTEQGLTMAVCNDQEHYHDSPAPGCSFSSPVAFYLIKP